MGRPIKRTVDYFSHDSDASESRTITIIENHFGAEGYATWFKLLERVSRVENHFICLKNTEDIEFLSAKLKVKPDKMLEILDKLAELDAIDLPLWRKRVIWCQNFVNRLHWVYENRRQPLPKKPLYLLDNKTGNTDQNDVSTENNGDIQTETEETTTESTQSKVKEGSKGRKGNPAKGKWDKDISELLKQYSPAFQKAFDDFAEMRKDNKHPLTLRAVELALKKLSELTSDETIQIAILNQSTFHSWQGLFSLKEDRDNGSKPQQVRSKKALPSTDEFLQSKR